MGTWRLTRTVVPGSGTGMLAGINGVFRFRMKACPHHDELDHALEPETSSVGGAGWAELEAG